MAGCLTSTSWGASGCGCGTTCAGAVFSVACNGTPQAGATVAVAGGGTGTTDASGLATVALPPAGAGTYTVTVTLAGGTVCTRSIAMICGGGPYAIACCPTASCGGCAVPEATLTVTVNPTGGTPYTLTLPYTGGTTWDTGCVANPAGSGYLRITMNCLSLSIKSYIGASQCAGGFVASSCSTGASSLASSSVTCGQGFLWTLTIRPSCGLYSFGGTVTVSA